MFGVENEREKEKKKLYSKYVIVLHWKLKFSQLLSISIMTKWKCWLPTDYIDCIRNYCKCLKSLFKFWSRNVVVDRVIFWRIFLTGEMDNEKKKHFESFNFWLIQSRVFLVDCLNFYSIPNTSLSQK